MSDEPPRPGNGLRLLATSKELAELFGHSTLSALGNWRLRYPDFPEPVRETSSGALYDVDQVLEWARDPHSPAHLTRRPDWWWARTVDALRAAVALAGGEPDDRVRSFLAAFVLENAVLDGRVRGYRSARRTVIATADDPQRELLDVGAHLEAEYPALRGLLLEPLESVRVPPPILADLLGRLATAADQGLPPDGQLDLVLAELPAPTPDQSRSTGGRNAAETTTSETLTRIVIGMATPTPGDIVYDPCAGEGGLVIACARAILGQDSQDPRRVRVVAQELDARASRILRTRLLLEGVNADVGPPNRSSIGEDQFPALRAHVVVADPPVTPRSPLVDWVEHALHHLDARGRAVLVLPAHALTDIKQSRRVPEPALEQRLRQLLEEGRVMAVTIVSSRLRRDVTGPLTVWELSNQPASGQLLSLRWSAETTTKPTADDTWQDEQVEPEELFDRIGAIARRRTRQGSRPRQPDRREVAETTDAAHHRSPAPSAAVNRTSGALRRAVDDLSFELEPLLDRLPPDDLHRDRVRRALEEVQRALP